MTVFAVIVSHKLMHMEGSIVEALLIYGCIPFCFSDQDVSDQFYLDSLLNRYGYRNTALLCRLIYCQAQQDQMGCSVSKYTMQKSLKKDLDCDSLN